MKVIRCRPGECLAAITIMLLTAAGVSLAQSGVFRTDTLRAIQEYGGRSGENALNHPLAVEVLPDGRIVILDSGNNRLVIVAANSGELLGTWGSIGSCENELNTPSDLELGEDRLYVADTGNRRVVMLDFELNWLGTIDLDFNIDGLTAGPAGSVFVSCRSRKADSFLLARYDHQGRLLGQVPEQFGIETDPWNVRTALNRVHGCWLGSERLLLVFRGLPFCRTITSGGELQASWLIKYDIDAAREWFYQANPGFFAAKELVPVQRSSLEDFIDDIRRADRDGLPRSPIYLSDVDRYGDHVLVVAGCHIHEYDRAGNLIRRTYLQEQVGRDAFVRDIAIDSAGFLYGVDPLHYRKCYKFGYVTN